MSESLPELSEVKRVSLRPGDVVVVRTTARISAEVAHRIKTVLGAKFPGHEIAVLDQSMDLAVWNPAQPLCGCGNDLTVSEAENGWECAACRWEADQDTRAER